MIKDKRIDKAIKLIEEFEQEEDIDMLITAIEILEDVEEDFRSR